LYRYSLVQTETWLDQAIFAAEGLRSENDHLRLRLAEAARECADAAESAAEVGLYKLNLYA
jgi:hypothetical protein